MLFNMIHLWKVIKRELSYLPSRGNNLQNHHSPTKCDTLYKTLIAGLKSQTLFCFKQNNSAKSWYISERSDRSDFSLRFQAVTSGPANYDINISSHREPSYAVTFSSITSNMQQVDLKHEMYCDLVEIWKSLKSLVLQLNCSTQRLNLSTPAQKWDNSNLWQSVLLQFVPFPTEY